MMRRRVRSLAVSKMRWVLWGSLMVDFEIRGKFKVRNSWQSFSKVIESQNEKNAMEKVYSLLGSEQGVKRNLVRIEEVKALG